MAAIKWIISILCRSFVVGAGYAVVLVIAGAVSTALGAQIVDTAQGIERLLGLTVGGLVIGLVLGPIAGQLNATRSRQFLIWASVIFLNLTSVIIEGAFFEPARIRPYLPILTVQQFLVAGSTAGIITLLFAGRDDMPSPLPRRAWQDWLWRLAVSGASYLLFYFIFGAINYSLVTHPYYESHAGGLDMPGVGTIFIAETIRAGLIVLSVLPFLLTVGWPTGKRVIWTGIILFAIGGIVPLLNLINVLPLPLLLASGVEIFFQNFSTGVVAGSLLGRVPTRQPYIRGPRTENEPIIGRAPVLD